MRLVFLPVLLVFLFQGCGHKGPLYLPTEQKPAANAPIAPQPAAEEKKP